MKVVKLSLCTLFLVQFSANFLMQKKIILDIRTNNLHLALQHDYPQADILPMPHTYDLNEAIRFSPHALLRTRDIISAMNVLRKISDYDITLEQEEFNQEEDIFKNDRYVKMYDRQNSCSLSSCMQSQVPFPYSQHDESLHYSWLSCPGGQWGMNF
jgi:hypothetical protein